MTKPIFKLKKIKVAEQKAFLDYSETVVLKDGKKESFDKTANSETCVPHEDLLNSVSKLKEYLLRSLKYYHFYEMAKQFSTTPKAKDEIENEFLDLLNDVTVTGVSISGQNDFKSVVITGKIKNQMNGKSALNSPRIVLNGDHLGYESHVEDYVEIIEAEAYKYIYEGKKGNLDLFDNQETPKEKAKAEA